MLTDEDIKEAWTLAMRHGAPGVNGIAKAGTLGACAIQFARAIERSTAKRCAEIIVLAATDMALPHASADIIECRIRAEYGIE